MAAKALDIEREDFCCPICLDFLKDPVTIPCGHSYCMTCVETHWNGEVGKPCYSCPQCRQRFTQRPLLVKNSMLAFLMDCLQKTGAPAAGLSHCSAAQGHVSCDLCSGRKLKALKSCLQCLVSYCEEHLQPHYHVAALKKHKLVEPTENLQDNICSRHDEVMKMFCRTDQQCICYLCSMDQHKGHHTVTAAAERTEKQRELELFSKNVLQRIQNKEEEMVSLQREEKNIGGYADAAVENSERSFKELFLLLEKRLSEVKQQIRSQQKVEEQRVKELQAKVQQDLSKLRRRHSELDSLSRTEDHSHFLHMFAALSKAPETSSSSSRIPPCPFQDMVTAAVSKLSNKLQEACQLDPPAESLRSRVCPPKTHTHPTKAAVNVPLQQSSVETFPSLFRQSLKQKLYLTHPTRLAGDYRKKHSRQLTLDRCSLNNGMVLSKGGTFVKRARFTQNYEHSPNRFTDVAQVVSKESLTGECYWEVLGKYTNVFTVAVAYEDLRRHGASSECCFGKNDRSWALECYHGKFVFWHHGVSVEIQTPRASPQTSPQHIRIGVFLDHSHGVLSFFLLHDNNEEHIYTTVTNFTQPLVAGVRLEEDKRSTAEFC